MNESKRDEEVDEEAEKKINKNNVNRTFEPHPCRNGVVRGADLSPPSEIV